MTEPEVIHNVRRHLGSKGLLRRGVSLVYTDAHPTLTDDRRLRPFQRFFVQPFDGDPTGGPFVMRFVHPDLVGLLNDGESLFAIEAKGQTDIPRGVQQASSYQSSVHSSWLAAPVSALGDGWVRQDATARGVGLLGVHDDGDVELLLAPRVTLPTLRGALHVRAHFSIVSQLSAASTYGFNIPSRYLAPLLVMEPVRLYSIEALVDALEPVPVLAKGKRGVKAVLGGAKKLGVLARRGREYQLTPLGVAAKKTLPKLDLRQLALLHRGTKLTKSRTLARLQPSIAGVLQLLLLRDAAVALIIQALQSMDNCKGSELDLACRCETIDPAISRVLFVTPERLSQVSGPDGRIKWDVMDPAAFRDTTSQQLRMILQHAGILSSVRGSRKGPAHRFWALAPQFWEHDAFSLSSPKT